MQGFGSVSCCLGVVAVSLAEFFENSAAVLRLNAQTTADTAAPLTLW